jgi:hypothetical protein
MPHVSTFLGTRQDNDTFWLRSPCQVPLPAAQIADATGDMAANSRARTAMPAIRARILAALQQPM